MLLFMESYFVKIGGPNKTVEIDESKFGWRMYCTGHPVQGQWVYGAVESPAGHISFPYGTEPPTH